jgi:hypothetical protein
VIRWYKRDGDKVTPNNKEGLLLRYHENHTCVVDGTYYPHEDVNADVGAVSTPDVVTATVVTINITPTTTPAHLYATATHVSAAADTVTSAVYDPYTLILLLLKVQLLDILLMVLLLMMMALPHRMALPLPPSSLLPTSVLGPPPPSHTQSLSMDGAPTIDAPTTDPDVLPLDGVGGSSI